jgi:hypothetical protein
MWRFHRAHQRLKLAPYSAKLDTALGIKRQQNGQNGNAVSPQLKLIALDEEDLAVISAHVQDARVQTSDIIWRQGEKRLVIGMNRLDWEQTLAGETSPRRLIAALRFDRVLACKSRNIDLAAPENVLELVGIEFHPAKAPGGSAVLMFSRGEALRLDVECLECELSDLGTDDLGAGDSGESAPSSQEGG